MLLGAVLGRALAAIAQTFSTIDTTAAGVITDDRKYWGAGWEKYAGAAAVGTKIFFAPSNEYEVGVLDTTTSTFSTTSAGTLQAQAKYRGAAAVGTKIFFSPHNENVGVLDTIWSA